MKLVIKEDEMRTLRLERVPLPQFTTFELEPERITSKAGNGKVRTIKPAKQLELLEKHSNALMSNFTFCISSGTTDSTAKFVAAWMYLRLMKEYQKRATKSDFVRGKPAWHIVTGSFKDELRDDRKSGKSKPAALILTNVPHDATNIKLEKVRDLLEMYNDIPRIVVTTGMDPVEFFSSKLSYPLNGAVMIASKSRRRSESI